jgi:hypothetical protein
MHKKTQPLRRIVLLLILLGIVAATFVGSYTSALANSYHSFTARPKQSSKYFYIMQAGSFSVCVDIQGNKTQPGTPLILYPKKTLNGKPDLWRA